jgi:hypothetical protein
MEQEELIKIKALNKFKNILDGFLSIGMLIQFTGQYISINTEFFARLPDNDSFTLKFSSSLKLIALRIYVRTFPNLETHLQCSVPCSLVRSAINGEF